jgi:hypothetical protein
VLRSVLVDVTRPMRNHEALKRAALLLPSLDAVRLLLLPVAFCNGGEGAGDFAGLRHHLAHVGIAHARLAAALVFFRGKLGFDVGQHDGALLFGDGSVRGFDVVATLASVDANSVAVVRSPLGRGFETFG